MTLERNRWLAGALGRNGRHFFKEHYDWPVIERKYLDMIERLKKDKAPAAVAPLPGWSERRRQNVPAAREVLARTALSGVRG